MLGYFSQILLKDIQSFVSVYGVHGIIIQNRYCLKDKKKKERLRHKVDNLLLCKKIWSFTTFSQVYFLYHKSHKYFYNSCYFTEPYSLLYKLLFYTLKHYHQTYRLYYYKTLQLYLTLLKDFSDY